MTKLIHTTLLFIATLILAHFAFAQAVTDPDINDDGVVNAIDLGLLRSCFFADLLVLPACTVADFNGDESVNVVDLGILRSRFFQSIPTQAEAASLFDAIREPVGGDEPDSAQAADLDRDGLTDLIFITADSLTIHWATGSGQFEVATLASAGRVLALRVGDLDADGLLDIAGIGVQPGSLKIYRGLGQRQFAAPSSYPVPALPGWLELADIDGDDDLDVLVALVANNRGTSVFINDGGGALSLMGQVPIWDLTTSVSACDLNKDDILDLVMTGFAGFEVFVAYGFGDGTFAPVESTFFGYQFMARCQDLNGDQSVDVALARGDGIHLFLGDNEGGFADSIVYSTPGTVRSIQIEDVDSDGWDDLISENRGDRSVSVFLNDRADGFGDAVTTSHRANGIRPTVANLSPDGLPDLVVTDKLSDSFRILGGIGTGDFISTIVTYDTGPTPQSVTVADVNGDGIDDVLTVSDSERSIFLSPGLGTGRLGPPIALPIDLPPEMVHVRDLDNDGLLDLVIATGGFGITVRYGLGQFAFEPAVRFGDTDSAAFTRIAIADFNGDGRLDVAGSRTFRNQGNVILALGPRSFTPPFDVEFGEPTEAITAVDIDDDGKVDLVAAEDNGSVLYVAMGAGDGSFLAPVLYPLSSIIYDIVAADLNDDGLVDLACVTGAQTDILLNQAEGGFSISTVQIPDNSFAVDVLTRDVNGDDYLDLVLSGTASQMSVFLGNGDGGFQSGAIYPTYAGSIGMGHLNEDDRLDLVLVDRYDALITVLPQN